MLYTMDGAIVYLRILKQLQTMVLHISHNDSKFLRLLLDHASFIERHWRKLVRDIRLGTLNRHVQVLPIVREMYLRTAIPQPRLADRLDRELRLLGFHVRASNTEVQCIPYAKFAHPPPPASKARRHTFSGFNRSAKHSKKRRRASTGSWFIPRSAEIHRAVPPPPPNSTATAPQIEPLSSTTTAHMTNDLLHDGDHWVCPFPGCGMSFRMKYPASLHLGEHDWTHALQTANSTSDQYLHLFWPDDAPWSSTTRVHKRYWCAKCRYRAVNQAALDKHSQLAHPEPKPSLGWRWIGPYVLCPPFEPPENAPLIICKSHRYHRSRCPVCVLSRQRKGLQPPIRYYKQLELQLQPEHDIGISREYCRIQCNDEDQGVVVDWPAQADFFHSSTTATKPIMTVRHCRLLALCEDSERKAWMAVQGLYTAEHAKAHGKQLPPNFDFPH